MIYRDKEVDMLVLSRKSTQTVMIGSDIRVTIVRLEGNQVRIGIEAPGDVRILRGELADEAGLALDVVDRRAESLEPAMS